MTRIDCEKRPARDALLRHWRAHYSTPELRQISRPHQLDREVIRSERYWVQMGVRHTYTFHECRNAYAENIAPIPYVGTLFKPRILILMANPKLSRDSFIDHVATHEPYIGYRNRIVRCVLQEDQNFYPLDDDLWFTGSYRYFIGMLQPLIDAVAIRRPSISRGEVLGELRKKITLVDLVPYHADRIPGAGRRCSSALLARDCVREMLECEKEIRVITVFGRGRNEWNEPAIQATIGDRLFKNRLTRSFGLAHGDWRELAAFIAP